VTDWLESVPSWMRSAVWTALTIGAAWCIGHLLNAIVITRLGRLIAAARKHWDQAVVSELRRRVPLWSVLVGAYASLAHWQLSPEAALLLTRGLFVVGAVSATLFAAAVASRLIAAYGAMVSPALPVTSLTQSLTWVLIVALGALVVLNGLGVSITPMLTAMGVGGLAVALALQEPLANLFAGIVIALARQVRVGDYVKLDGGVEGYVTDFSWWSTRIRMLSNNMVLVPNAKLAQAIVTNYHLPAPDLVVPVDVVVDPSSDLPRVERVAVDVGREVMRDVPCGVRDHEPFVQYTSFATANIGFQVMLRSQEFAGQYLIKHEFLKRLHERYAREGIVIRSMAKTPVVRT
jgi:small-conductance mechanosensitive channel